MSAGASGSSRLATVGSAYAGAVVVQVVVQGASLPVLTRLLDPAEYGLMATTLVVANLLAVLVDLGLSRAVTRAFYREPDGPGQAAALAVAALAVAAVLSLTMLLAVPLWGGWLGQDARGTVQAAVALGAAMAGRNVVLGLLRAAQRSRAYVIVMLSGTAGAQLVGLAAAAVSPTPVAYLTGLAVGSAFGIVVGLAVQRPAGGRPRDRAVATWALQFALPLLPAELAAVTIWFADRIVIERFLGLEAVGRYQIAYTLGSVLLMLAMGVSQAWAPIIYGAPVGDRARVADETRALLLRLAAYGVAALALVGPVVLVLVIPGRYRPGDLAAVTALIALAVLPLIAQQAATHLLSDADRTAVLGSRGLLAAMLNLVGNLLLVPLWGLTGSAVATLLTYLFYAAAVSRAARRHTGAELRLHWFPCLLAGVGALAGGALPVGGALSLARCVATVAVLGLCAREFPALAAQRRRVAR